MKCYVCKFVNQAAEARRHPNPTTVATAKLLHARMLQDRKTNQGNLRAYNHTCYPHQDSSQRQVDLQRAFKDLHAAYKVVLP
jgi:hypothetical protein